MRTSILLLAGLAAAWLSPATAEPVTQTVSYAGLDLTSNSGQQILNRRVARAVAQICGTPGTLDLAAQRSARRCARDAAASASPQVIRVVAVARTGIRIAQAR